MLSKQCIDRVYIIIMFRLTTPSTDCTEFKWTLKCFASLLKSTYLEVPNILIFSQVRHSLNRRICHSQSDKGQSIVTRHLIIKFNGIVYMTLRQNAVISTNRWSDSTRGMVVRSPLLSKMISAQRTSCSSSRGNRFQSLLMLENWSWSNSCLSLIDFKMEQLVFVHCKSQSFSPKHEKNIVIKLIW